MKKFYDKHETLFAILCIVIYVVVMGNLRSFGDDSLPNMLGLIVISGLMFAFVKINHLEEKYGLAGWVKNSKAMLYLIPLWIVTTGNLWSGIELGYSGTGLIFGIISMALVGFAEEMIFRGFLFKAMLRDSGVKPAVIVSSVTFGIGHIVNLLTGHGGIETLVQVCYAVAIGFIMVFVYYKGGSLLPCIISHSLIDVFSKIGEAQGVAEWLYYAVVIITAIVYCIYLGSKVETPAINRITPEVSGVTPDGD